MPRPLLALLVPIAAALLISACGGSSKDPSGTDPADRALAFSRCMREHGVKNFPDPQTSGGGAKLTFKAGPGGPSPKTMEAAQTACRHFMAADQKQLTPQERVQREEQVNRFARCMREHGINVHGNASGGGVQIQIHPSAGAGPNPESPAFKAAQKACSGLLPFKGSPQTSNSTSEGAGPGFGIAGG